MSTGIIYGKSGSSGGGSKVGEQGNHKKGKRDGAALKHCIIGAWWRKDAPRTAQKHGGRQL